MSRPRLTSEDLVLRPRYVKLLAHLFEPESRTGISFSQLCDQLRLPRGALGKPGRVAVSQSLSRLRTEGIVDFQKFSSDSTLRDRAPYLRSGKGRPASGVWTLAPKGRELWDLLSAVHAKRNLIRDISPISANRIHLVLAGEPTILVMNTDPSNVDKGLYDGPLLGAEGSLARGALELAIYHWAASPQVKSDWKALQTLKRKHPRDYSRHYSIQEGLKFKFWPPTVRSALRRTAKHTIWVVLEMNPAFWDTLPIERLEHVTAERKRQSRKLSVALMRVRRRAETR
jgi:hypothetical protein